MQYRPLGRTGLHVSVIALGANWLRKTGRRNDIVLATKATGPLHKVARPSHVRGGRLSHTRSNLFEAVDLSLQLAD